MQAKINYELDEQTQRELIAATGQPVTRIQYHQIEVTPDDIGYFEVNAAGQLSLFIAGTPLSAKSPEEAFFLHKAARCAEKASRQALIDEELRLWDLAHEAEDAAIAYLQERGINSNQGGLSSVDILREMGVLDAAHKGALWLNYAKWQRPEENPTARLDQEIKRLYQEASERAQEAKQQAEAEKEAAKTAFISEWIRKNASTEINEQLEEGLLDRKIALAMIADAAFAAIGIEKYTPPSTCLDRACPCRQATITTLPPKVYPDWKSLKAKLPAEATVELRHVIEHVDIEEDETYDDVDHPEWYAASINLPVGPFQFVRMTKIAEAGQ